ncbi:lysozyme [Actinoplanes sp. DH11]|uniref:lysozyme n=1 Tax=Actinoplanes sp. DH11 TaxID=2857011 RepID=UPI001E4A5B5B|nr:lysozyme [Actinoplanes sp. DH11]
MRLQAIALTLVTGLSVTGLSVLGPAPPSIAASSTLQQTPVAVAATPTGRGYWVATRSGEVAAYGDAPAVKDLPDLKVRVANIVGAAASPSGRGLWLAGADGGVFALGDAGFHKSLPGLGVRVSNVVGIAATPSGRGYWLAGADGGVFAFGDAGFHKSLPGLGVRVSNVVGITATPSGRGYWLTGSDGGVFAFGDAGFFKSLGGVRLNAPVTGMTRTPTGGGYTMVARDGGIFTFGDARFLGRPTVANVPQAPAAGTRQPARNLTVSGAGVEFIALWEGFRAAPYDDGYGTCTVGYGFALHAGRCTAEEKRQRMDQDLAKSMLRDKAERTYASALRSAHPDLPLRQAEFDALVSLVFNTGPGPVRTGTVGATLRARDYAKVPKDLLLYVNAGGRKVCGLYSRRVSEGNLFTNGSYARLSPRCPF